MTLKEAMEIAADCLTVAPLGSLTPQREEAAALLRRLIPFVEAAMEWGDWYDQKFPTTDNWSAEESRMILAYRAIKYLDNA